MTSRNLSRPIDSSFDVVFADALAQLETYNKHHYRPNTYLHKWWGRRCGTTFRLILKGLVDEPGRQSYYEPGGLEGKTILDPMMGGGTTLHEAIRLGASVIGVDIDPIPVLQARAALTEKPIRDLQTAFTDLYDRLVDSVGPLSQTHCPECDARVPLWYALYGLRRRCGCREVLVVDSLVLRHEADGRMLRLCPDCGGLVEGTGHHCAGDGIAIIDKRQSQCDCCGEVYEDAVDLPYFNRYKMMVVAARCETHGLFHKSPDERDKGLLEQANAARARLSIPMSEFDVTAGDKSIQLLNRGIHNYLDLFSSRQLLYLDVVLHNLPGTDPVTRLNLALLVSTSLEFNSMLCSHKGVNKRRAGAVRHAFSYHGYSFPYTALENNPMYPQRASGTLQKLFQSRIVRARRWAASPRERVIGEASPGFVPIHDERDSGIEVGSQAELSGLSNRFLLIQGSSRTLPIASGTVDAVVTDPPYYDSIQYGDLAAFFRVWLRQFLPQAADWDYDESDAAVGSTRMNDSAPYAELMAGIFQECRRVLIPGTGRLIFTFHHWHPRAWAALTVALFRSRFELVNRYVVHAENPISVHVNNMRALTHDAILVFAAREHDCGGRWPRPESVDQHDSRRFTEGCADFLGWTLDQSGLTKDQSEELWTNFLTGRVLPVDVEALSN